MAIAIIMENAHVYCCQGILNCHMTFAGSVISLARSESWPRIAMISKKLAIVTIRISATPPSKKKYVWLARLVSLFKYYGRKEATSEQVTNYSCHCHPLY